MTFFESHKPYEKTYVLYHANCFDGLGAAYAAWQGLGDSNTEYIPVQYGENPPQMEAGSNVYIVDFSYKRDVLDSLRSTAANLVVLDHHKTAAEDLAGYPGAVFDMSKSGAVLSWEYFHPGSEVPVLLDYIQDRDLWTWQYPLTKPVMAAMELYKGDFRNFGKLDRNKLLQSGYAKLQFDELELEKAVKKALIVKYPNYPGSTLACALLNTTSLISETGNKLCKELPVDFSLSFFVEKSGDIVFSFRSLEDFDVSALAKALGGGGHRNAAGARVSSAAGYALLGQLYSSATSGT